VARLQLQGDAGEADPRQAAQLLDEFAAGSLCGGARSRQAGAGMRHFRRQLIGGRCCTKGQIAEMKTVAKAKPWWPPCRPSLNGNASPGRPGDVGGP